MAQEQIQHYIQSINHTIEDILNTVQELSEETIRWNPTDEEWSILQILNHLVEATPYWLTEMENVLQQPGTQWGRGLQHPERLAAVANPSALDLDVVLTNFKGLKQQVDNRLSKVADERLKEENPHRNFEKFGNKPVSFIIEHFIDEHIAKHHGQIQRNLEKLGSKTK